MNFSGKHLLLWAFKIALFVLLIWFVVDRLFVQNDANAEYRLFAENFGGGKFYFFLVAVVLMPVNWLLETAKWKLLLNTRASLTSLLKSVIAGITIGFITPGRSGEFIGRAVFLEDYNKTKAFYLSGLGGFAQTAASLVIGVPLVYIWSGNHLWAETTMGVAVIYLLAFFRFDVLNKIIASIPFLQRYGLTITLQDLPNINVQVAALALSFVRFSVYLLQYVLLLSFFGITIPFLTLTVHSAVFLIAQTFSPLMPLLDVGFRSGSALVIFKPVTDNNLAVLSAVMVVWLINLVIPALAGYWFILRKTNFKWTI